MSVKEFLLEIIQEAKLKHLTRLDLSGNKLTDLPPELFQLEKLETLDLDENRLSELSADIGHLKSLKRLSVRKNQLTGLPDEIGQLSALSWFYLDDNHLSCLPESISQLKKLTRLSLRRNVLESLPSGIGALSELMVLNLENNKLRQLPPEIGKLKNVKTIHVNDNLLTALPEEIAYLSNLTRLSVQNNQLEQIPDNIEHLQELVWLFAQGNRLTGLPRSMGNLKYLETLNVCNNRLKTLPAELALIGNLSKLYIDGNRITKLPPEIIHFKKFFGLKALPKKIEPEKKDEPTETIQTELTKENPQNIKENLSPECLDMLERQIAHLPKGKLVFDPPSRMLISNPVSLSAGITRDLTHDANRLSQLIQHQGLQAIEALNIQAFATAGLIGLNFKIERLSREEQEIPLNGFARMEWIVTPLVTGTQELQMQINVVIKTLGKENQLAPQIETYSIQIEAIPFESLRNFFRKNYLWVIIAIIVIAGLTIGILI